MQNNLSIAVIPGFFGIPYLQRVKSSDKCEVYASVAAFFQKAFSAASPDLFCPLRYSVNYEFILSGWI
ncbi:hypothetical protein SAMN06272722_102946 [Paenibacillus sp. RU5A]|nr:hypothetical protein SAMN03159332_0701 [Paenibacillus sp. 276b]SLJ99558.1 hypothetical protein SAMN06272722_102946 [Paenibacillus sp. RU5A]SOC66572.1 hypothetical protein SAMN05880581_10251 [Paenibacillus sp. RU26A]SOC70459.1 hypothetical protein SAMN05880586_102946 [Paenibacillus sp. RU5M]